MKPRYQITAALIIAAGLTIALDARQSTTAADEAMPRKYWLVTPVTLDKSGRIETAGTPTILDAQTAYRLAAQLAAEESAAKAGVDAPFGARTAEGGRSTSRQRCQATATSTGQQCKRFAVPGSTMCTIHQDHD